MADKSLYENKPEPKPVHAEVGTYEEGPEWSSPEYPAHFGISTGGSVTPMGMAKSMLLAHLTNHGYKMAGSFSGTLGDMIDGLRVNDTLEVIGPQGVQGYAGVYDADAEPGAWEVEVNLEDTSASDEVRGSLSDDEDYFEDDFYVEGAMTGRYDPAAKSAPVPPKVENAWDELGTYGEIIHFGDRVICSQEGKPDWIGVVTRIEWDGNERSYVVTMPSREKHKFHRKQLKLVDRLDDRLNHPDPFPLPLSDDVFNDIMAGIDETTRRLDPNLFRPWQALADERMYNLHPELKFHRGDRVNVKVVTFDHVPGSFAEAMHHHIKDLGDGVVKHFRPKNQEGKVGYAVVWPDGREYTAVEDEMTLLERPGQWNAIHPEGYETKPESEIPKAQPSQKFEPPIPISWGRLLDILDRDVAIVIETRRFHVGTSPDDLKDFDANIANRFFVLDKQYRDWNSDDTDEVRDVLERFGWKLNQVIIVQLPPVYSPNRSRAEFYVEPIDGVDRNSLPIEDSLKSKVQNIVDRTIKAPWMLAHENGQPYHWRFSPDGNSTWVVKPDGSHWYWHAENRDGMPMGIKFGPFSAWESAANDCMARYNTYQKTEDSGELGKGDKEIVDIHFSVRTGQNYEPLAWHKMSDEIYYRYSPDLQHLWWSRLQEDIILGTGWYWSITNARRLHDVEQVRGYRFDTWTDAARDCEEKNQKGES